MKQGDFLADALANKGTWQTYRWLVTRRLTQLTILVTFSLGPWFGIWILEGNLSSSVVLGWLPLTDPFVLLQSLAAGHKPAAPALVGVIFVLVIYVVLGGRVFCSWVCPVNIVTDCAGWLRRRLHIRSDWGFSRRLRFWLMLACFVSAWVTGSLAWEYVNPVSALSRGLLFGMGWTTGLIGAIFLFDLLVAHRGWCGHLCPMGAFYRMIGTTALLRVSAGGRTTCTNCMDCFVVCPEPQVIKPALKGHGTPLILDADCTTCGRCVDVCAENVFRITHRFDTKLVAGR